jgi:hypothetical protein
VDAALGADVLAEDQQARVGGQLLVEDAADGGDHVDPLALRPRLVGRRRLEPGAAADPARRAGEEHVVADPGGIEHRPRLGLGDRRLDLVGDAGLDQLPVEVGGEGLELWQGIARPLGLDHLLRLVGLCVLGAMAFQPRNGQPQQHRPLAGADMADGLRNQPRRFLRLGAVAVEDGEAGKARQVGGDVLARRLIVRRHGDAVAIVLDEEEQRQCLRGGDGQRRPEAAGGAAGVAAEDDGDGIARPLAQLFFLIFDRLRPAGRRRILGADAAAHRQGVAAAGIGVIEDDADVAAVGIAAGAAHAGAERVGQLHAQRQQQRPRAIIAAGGVAVPELQPEQHLRQVMAARRKLVEHLLFRDEPLFLDPVHGATGQHQPGDRLPVDLRADGARIDVSHR